MILEIFIQKLPTIGHSNKRTFPVNLSDISVLTML